MSKGFVRGVIVVFASLGLAVLTGCTASVPLQST